MPARLCAVQIDFVGVLSGMFKEVALLLEAHEATAARTFGPEAAAALVAGLQAEVDVYGKLAAVAGL